MSAALTLSFDMAAFEAALGELLALADAGKLAPEVCERLVGVVEAGGKVFVLEVDRGAAAAAGHLVMRAKPSDLFLGFMAACRAGDAQLGLVEDALRHIETSAFVSQRILDVERAASILRHAKAKEAAE